MNQTKRTLLKSALATLMGAALLQPVMAQEKSYPTKPITFVVPYSPGGPLDGVARLLAEHAGKTLKQTIIV
ncbi:MAG: tripartite tricarboxylate transporter substrate binding protein, partial [Advenella sp.]